MPKMTISVSSEAYERLKERKEPGESFSQVILRELPPVAMTCGALLQALEHTTLPKGNPAAMEALRSGRGRRADADSK